MNGLWPWLAWSDWRWTWCASLPRLYIGIGAALAAGILAYFVRRRLAARWAAFKERPHRGGQRCPPISFLSRLRLGWYNPLIHYGREAHDPINAATRRASRRQMCVGRLRQQGVEAAVAMCSRSSVEGSTPQRQERQLVPVLCGAVVNQRKWDTLKPNT